MENSVQALIRLSNKYGTPEFVIGGGGNSSFKDGDTMWIKASGSNMSTIEENGFVQVSRLKLNELSNRVYSSDPEEREHQVAGDILDCVIAEGDSLKPSVETLIHNLIEHSYVIHTHPWIATGLLCSSEAEQESLAIFGDEAAYIDYADPGYDFFKKAEEVIVKYRISHSSDPKIILVQNHGVFISAGTESEIELLYSELLEKIKLKIKEPLPEGDIPIDPEVTAILPAIRSIVSKASPKILTIRSNALVRRYTDNPELYINIKAPFTPDNIIHCKSEYLFTDMLVIAQQYPERFKERYDEFVKNNGFEPEIMIIRGFGIVAASFDAETADAALDTFEDMMKISFVSENFGGPVFMRSENISFIEKRVAENKIPQNTPVPSEKLSGKIAIVTGGSQGFGEGIVRDFHLNGANVIIADIKDTEGKNLSESLNESGRKNIVHYVHTDVSDFDSLQNLVFQTVCNFGGIDIVVSNAGILRAGSIDMMDVNTFDLVTKINYSSYFMVVKAFTPVLKLQTKYNPTLFTDIIQINSKSGLKGSNKNFAYAGGKFGGIGLTQSFALELIQDRIKVNAICPGNFFDGPLWSDPDNGLFVQYLRTGKVPGAKTIEEVKRFYESQVPANRGCRVEDVMKAIYYVIDQEYETGQAIPVTGGQVMLS